jgi:outer membrane protein TolC
LQTSLAREQIASAVALSYLNVLRDDLAVQAATADLELAQALLKLAQDQRAAGIATGIDVVRAENSVVQQRLRLAQAQGAAEQSRLTLERVIGVRQGSTFSLSDQLSFKDEPPAVLADALTLAALAAFNAARVNLAAALGQAERFRF